MGPRGKVLVLFLSLVLLGLASLALGSVHIPLQDVLSILAGGEASRPAWSTIVLDFRLPRTLAALLAGAGLAVSGLLMQTLFRNPLAGPYVLGISSGASVGVAFLILGGGTAFLARFGLLGDLGVIVAASLGAAVVLALVLAVARRVHPLTLLILGVLFGYGALALVTLLVHFSPPQKVRAYLAWTFGSFSGVTWGQLALLAPLIVLGLLLAFLAAKALNALLLGETYGRTLGLEVGRLRVLLLSATSILAGGVTAFCGPIGFLGVAVPHLARALLATADHRLLLPATALAGASLALLADLVSRLPGSQEVLPLNAVTALLGAPVIAWVILRRSTLGMGRSDA